MATIQDSKRVDDNVIPVEVGEPTGDCLFACGAKIRGVHNPTPHCRHIDERGRFRLTVYDSHSKEGMKRPRHDGGEVAVCRFNCPCKREAGRNQEMGFPPGYEEKDAQEGHDFPWQVWVTCRGVWEEVES